jgi:hypothetical protein
MKYILNLLVVFFVSSFVLSGCDNSSPSKKPTEQTDPMMPTMDEAVPEIPLTISSVDVCTIDAQCVSGAFCFHGRCAVECQDDGQCFDGERCGARGRCETIFSEVTNKLVVRSNDAVETEATRYALEIEDDTASVEQAASFEVEYKDSTIIEVSPDQMDVEFNIILTTPGPEGGILYSVETSDDSESAVEPVAVNRVLPKPGTERRYSFSIPTGKANPSAEGAGPVEVRLTTSVGNWLLLLQPELGVSGHYTGTVRFDTMPNAPIPFDFDIITDPVGVSLSRATTAHLVLSTQNSNVFAPFNGGASEVSHLGAPLEYDERIGLWSARFSERFVMAGATGEQTSPSLLGELGDEQVKRTMRIEIDDMGEGTLRGTIRDRWEGLFDTFSSQNVQDAYVLGFDGTIAVRRSGVIVADPNVVTESMVPAPNVQPQSAPEIDTCEDATFSNDAILNLEGEPCLLVNTVDEFKQAGVNDRIYCALAVADTALSNETTAQRLAGYLNGSDATGQSFEDFLTSCGDDANSECRPSAEVICARQLVAYATFTSDETATDIPALIKRYHSLTRESFLGLQLGAYHNDAQKRLEWLKTSDYPAIVTQAVKDLNTQLLDEWKQSVLDAHLATVAGQFSQLGLAVLVRDLENVDGADTRKQLIVDMNQSVRATIDTLTLATTRWHTLLDGDAERAEKAKFVGHRLRDLYITVGALIEFNRQADLGAMSAVLGGGLARLVKELDNLSLPFDGLIYARDAEVVTATSVDPTMTNHTLLRDREMVATEELASANEAVSSIIESAIGEALDQTQLRNRLNNEIDELRDELVLLCGRPAGCSGDNAVLPECLPRTGAGLCGLKLKKTARFDFSDYGTESPEDEESSFTTAGENYEGINVDSVTQRFTQDVEVDTNRSLLNGSRGGATLASVYEAVATVRMSELAVENAQNAAEAYKTLLDELKVALDARKVELDLFQSELDAKVDALTNEEIGVFAMTDADIKEYFTEINTAWDVFQVKVEGNLSKWDSLRKGNEEAYFESVIAETTLNSTAKVINRRAEAIRYIGDIMAATIPDSQGDDVPLAPFRLIPLMVGFTGWSVGGAVADGLEIAAASVRTAADKEKALADANLDFLYDQQELERLKTENEARELEQMIELANDNDDEKAIETKLVLDNLRFMKQLRIAYADELVEFEEKRFELLRLIQQIPEVQLGAARDQVKVYQKLIEYRQVVQEAELITDRMSVRLVQRTEINNLVGSPEVLFRLAHVLERAERRLHRAKSAMMDWLVALEYFAVRPFFDQRIQILLARNTFQLEEIFVELRRLESVCGGTVNTNTSTLSLREDLLGITRSITDPINDVILSPSTQVRQSMRENLLRMDQHIRYRSDATIGDLINNGNNRMLSQNFRIDLSDFANLASTCNAKNVALKVKLVGDLGTARPTVSILYDGTSQLRSCQPGLDAYIESIGAERTSFGEVSSFCSAGRAVSPVAGIGEFPESVNSSLGGLPLAGTYAILIDTELGENRNVNWDNLEDIELEIEYSYQDLFPEGQCE